MRSFWFQNFDLAKFNNFILRWTVCKFIKLRRTGHFLPRVLEELSVGRTILHGLDGLLIDSLLIQVLFLWFHCKMIGVKVFRSLKPGVAEKFFSRKGSIIVCVEFLLKNFHNLYNVPNFSSIFHLTFSWRDGGIVPPLPPYSANYAWSDTMLMSENWTLKERILPTLLKFQKCAHYTGAITNCSCNDHRFNLKIFMDTIFL